MKKFAKTIILLLFSALVQAQAVEYSVSFENRVHHEAFISMTVRNAPDAPLVIQMSRSSAGRYAIHHFAKNVYQVRAFDEQNKPLPLEHTAVDSWTVPRHNGTVRVSYILFGDHADGTYSSIDITHAHLNIPSAFMWAKGMENRPVKVFFELPKDSNWKVATQLKNEADGSFSAPDRYYFMDSPIEIANLQFREWEVSSGGKTQKIRLALHHTGTQHQADDYAGMIKKVVSEQISIWGELPAFDMGTYTFIACYVPHAKNDGMEHRNSTMLSSSAPLYTSAVDNLGTVSHELFHAWNVERLRPRSLEPFDFSRENMSGELWFAEGFTTYYGDLVLARAGYYTPEEFSQTLDYFINQVVNSPGLRYHSLVEMSQHAPFADAATSIDANNFSNVYISYYICGAATALALDLSLREKFKDVSLDTYMKALWEKYGKAETPYTLENLQNTLADVCKDKKFADEFFRKHIYGNEVPDFKKLFAEAGIELTRPGAGKASLGHCKWQLTNHQLMVSSYTTADSPLYEAGIDKGDVITKINEMIIQTTEDYTRALEKIKPGDKVKIELIKHGMPMTVEIKAGEDRWMQLVFTGVNQKSISKKTKKFLDNWLASKVK